MALDWAEDNCCSTSPIIIILPGLTGASQADYIKCLVAAAKNVGIKCVIFNNRGLGGVQLKVILKKSYTLHLTNTNTHKTKKRKRKRKKNTKNESTGKKFHQRQNYTHIFLVVQHLFFSSTN